MNCKGLALIASQLPLFTYDCASLSVFRLLLNFSGASQIFLNSPPPALYANEILPSIIFSRTLLYSRSNSGALNTFKI